MANTDPKVIILGHSFVKRLQRDLNSSFDPRARKDFKLRGTASVSLHGVGDRTVSKLRQFDLNILSRLRPLIVILEIGTNDLSHQRPEVVGSSIDDLVCHILGDCFERPSYRCLPCDSPQLFVSGGRTIFSKGKAFESISKRCIGAIS